MYNAKNQGSLYYLGTYGYTKSYKNPSSSKLVRAFNSTLYSGRPSDILEPSEKAKCTTQNKPNSFSGVTLQGRKLVPSAYSFTNT
jgi:hypothetical protein